MLVPQRNYQSPAYRYGFQGQEKDDEIKGFGNSINYKYRMHDPRVGRFFAVDPLFFDYPYNSPYAFSENKVISYRELEGLEAGPTKAQNKNGESQVHYKKTGQAPAGMYDLIQDTYEKVIPEGTPISESMTDNELYKYATQRYLKEGDYLVPEGSYVDERLQNADNLVNKFFSNHAPAWQYDKTVSAIVHINTMIGILSEDQAQQSAAVKMINKADDFLWNYSLADLIPFTASGKFLKLSLNNLYKAAQKRARRTIVVNSYKGGWGKANFQKILKKFAGNDPVIKITESGKVLYTNQATGIQIVQDPFHKYFRIENTRITGKRKFLNLEGNVPNLKRKANGKFRGSTPDEYKMETHFNYD